jgi:PTS system nitrogen regulatory IIA component
MKIADFLREPLVVANLAAKTKPDVLVELAGHLSRGQNGLDRGQILDVLVARERLASTGIGEGVAIPHGKLPGADGLIACLGRSREGIEFEAMDGQPAYLFFALLAPASSTGNHLKALARISRLFKDAEFRQRLLNADGGQDIFRLVTEEDARY